MSQSKRARYTLEYKAEAKFLGLRHLNLLRFSAIFRRLSNCGRNLGV